MRTPRRVALLLGVLLIASMPVGAVRAGGAIYLDDQGRFSLTIPDGWTVADLVDPGPTAVELDATNPWGIFSVATDGVTPDMALDQYATDAAEQQRRTLGNARVLPDGVQPTILGCEPARAFVVQGREQGTDVNVFVVVAFHDSTAFTLAFTTRPEDYDAYFAQEQAVLGSFAFTTRPAAAPAYR